LIQTTNDDKRRRPDVHHMCAITTQYHIMIRIYHIRIYYNIYFCKPRTDDDDYIVCACACVCVCVCAFCTFLCVSEIVGIPETWFILIYIFVPFVHARTYVCKRACQYYTAPYTSEMYERKESISGSYTYIDWLMNRFFEFVSYFSRTLLYYNITNNII